MRIVRILQSISAVSLTSAFVIFAFCIIQWVRGRPDSELDTGHSIVEEFKQGAGTQFDPKIVEALLSLIVPG